MAKVKKVFLTVLMLLLTVAFCIPFAACGNGQAEADKKSAATDESGEAVPYGLYTDLQFSLTGENGFVTASVKNKFTLFPSTVTVTVELYKSDTFQDDAKNMTLAASNYIYDLDQGETISATASTGGKSSYWKAKARYKIDSKAIQEKFSETVYFNADGIKSTASSEPVTDDKQYFVSDFLQGDAEKVMVSICPYNVQTDHPELGYYGEAFCWLENENELKEIKDLFGEIKLDEFDIDNKSYSEKQQFYFSSNRAPYMIYEELSDGSVVIICINDRYQGTFGANLFVRHYKHSASEDYNRCFTASIHEEAKQALINLTKNMLQKQKGE